MFDPKRLPTIEAEWQAIEESYRIDRYAAPTNRTEERDKVLAAYHEGRNYDPQFAYDALPSFPLARIRAFREQLQPERFRLEALYDERAGNELLAIEGLRTRAPGLITGASCLAYGLPDASLLAEARRILAQPAGETPTDAADKTISAEAAAGRLQEVLDSVGVAGWRALAFAPMNASMAVNGLDREVRIRRGDLFSPHDIRRLIVHEIGIHVLRYENGRQQPIRLFSSSFPGYIQTEEGIAVYSEARAGLLEAATLRKYAGRVLAANLALSQPFSAVFSLLAARLGPEIAFNIVSRAKRGFVDTAQPGAHTKDMVYLAGFLAVGKHLARQPEDYSLLLAGKFGLQHLPLVRSLLAEGSVTPPRWLPDDPLRPVLNA